MSEQPEPRFGEADLTNCDREPIHVPGSIQPHGALLALEEPELTVVQVSDNVEAVLGSRAEELLLRSFDELLGRERAALFRARYLGLSSFVDLNPVVLEALDPAGAVRVFDGVFHRSGGLLVLEIEPAPARAPGYVDQFVRRARTSLSALQSSGSVSELLGTAADRVRDLTGFDRVMVYRFDRDWHGVVVAEARREDLEPFLGLHYPASDIPRQARELYARNWLRLIPDVGYVPARLVPAENPATGTPLDLTFSVLRSVSPLHLEYLRNMGVAASLSISLLKDGRLWGLVACHHTRPRRLPYEVRAVCEFLGQVLSWQLSTKTEAERAARRLRAQQDQAQLVEAMSLDAAPLEGLLAKKERFLGFAGASGGALVYQGTLHTVGAVPPAAEILALVERLADSGVEEVFATDCLASLHPLAERFRDAAAGVLALALSREHRHFVLWFRPEAPPHRHLGRRPEQAGGGRGPGAAPDPAQVVRGVAGAGPAALPGLGRGGPGGRARPARRAARGHRPARRRAEAAQRRASGRRCAPAMTSSRSPRTSSRRR
ncbi:MAG: GAF domain-containing protein [Myxococcales bacterium]